MSDARVKIGVIGGGAWGTALACHLGGRGFDVTWWIREERVVESIAATGCNATFLPGVRVPQEVVVTSDLSRLGRDEELLLCVVPSQFCREVLRSLAGGLRPEIPLVFANKGIEEETLELPLQVAVDEVGQRSLGVLSGPSFASELARGRPTAVVIASSDPELGQSVQTLLSCRVLRLYRNDDPVGVQIAGALKNVMAIAAGVADSLGLGENTQAAMITRGLAEIARLGSSLGGRPETFAGLAGLGDLVLTCSGHDSRNRRVGQLLGRGESLQDILAGNPSVPEGVRTARSARRLARRQQVEMPIVDEVYRILYEHGSPQEALERLMRRPLVAEANGSQRSAS